MEEMGVVLWNGKEFGTLFGDVDVDSENNSLELWLDDASDYVVLKPDDDEADMLQDIEFHLTDRGVEATDLEIIWAGR